MFAARATEKRVSDAYRAESVAGPLPLPTSHEVTMSGGEPDPPLGSGGAKRRLTGGERIGADFAYGPLNLATTPSER
jgi:hypothetical protein